MKYRLFNILRHLLIGSVLVMMVAFYLREVRGLAETPLAVSQIEATAACASTPGCKKVVLGWRTNVEMKRKVPMVKLAFARTAKDSRASLEAKLAQMAEQGNWLQRREWATHQVEVSYE